MDSSIRSLELMLWNTPWWVYVLFIYCVFIGFKAARGGVVPYLKVIVIPVVFAYLSLDSLFRSFTMSAFVLGAYLIPLFVGVLLGYWQGWAQHIEVDRSRLLLRIPGTWSTLIIILIIFFTKYYFGYQSAVDPQLLTNTYFELSMLLVSGITAGLFIGRLIYYSYRLFCGPSIDIENR